MTRHGMSAADRAAWGSARTLAELGELTARWLEGDLVSQPGYCGPSDIEDPALVPVLAKLNRAGFMTTGSQIGEMGPGYEQRAAVEGFGSYEVAFTIPRRVGLTVITHPPRTLPRWRYRYDQSVAVTRVNGRDYTRFGVQLPRRHVRDPWLGYGICHQDAVTALCNAWQVTVIDLEWGRSDVLWRVLAAALITNSTEETR